MTLMKTKHLIVYAKRDRNFFVLELATPNNMMQITKYSQPTHLVSKSRQVRIWHLRFRYANNARIIKVLKLLTGIGNFSKVYNLIKIYSDFKQSNNNPSNNKGLVPIAKVSLLALLLDNNFDSLCTLCIANKQT